jgi:1-deoxy-D-xylulose-5-phosphate synthase
MRNMSSLENSKYKYLFNIDDPSDLRKLRPDELGMVSDEVREFLIDTITKTGGHFGAGLGIVELTVALHYVFNTPSDKIIFDTGHQGYPHKVLTGRRDSLHTIRKKGGLSGFLKRSESEYDVFGAGHASTSISSALGIATARDFNEKNYKVIAVIGDGAMTGGLAYEAMNNIGVQKRDIIVILNDNNISIEPNVSAFSNYFNEMYASSTVQSLKEGIYKMAPAGDFGDRLRKFASRVEDGVKAIVTPGVLFETLGFSYFGPINGNNIQKVLKMLNLIKDIKGPVFLHLHTKKGKGYAPAESDYQNLHAIGKIDKATGKAFPSATPVKKIPKYQDIFGDAMVEICKMNPKVVGITAAMGAGTGLVKLEKEFQDRLFDVGIAEGHAVTFAAGLASEGMIPVCAIYSSFLQRAFDSVVHDVSLQDFHVVFAIDRAGLVGSDGATHHGVLDLIYLRSIPNMVLMAPKDEQELRDMLYSAIYKFTKGPIAIRYPRGSGPEAELSPMKSIELGKSEITLKGKDIAILALGNMHEKAMKAVKLLSDVGVTPELINPRFVKPLDKEMLNYLFENFHTILTVEDGQINGGFGSAVLEFASEMSYSGKIERLGIPDRYIHHGTQEELYEELGIDSKGIADKVKKLINTEIKNKVFNKSNVGK